MFFFTFYSNEQNKNSIKQKITTSRKQQPVANHTEVAPLSVGLYGWAMGRAIQQGVMLVWSF